MYRPLSLTLLLLFTACDDKALVTVYQQKITQTPIPCMKLNLFPEDKVIDTALRQHYAFSDDCDLTLEVSHKSGIKCNSRFNVATKTTTNFPNSYLKLELRRGLSLQYSYYMDLTAKPDAEDVAKGWERLERDLKIDKKVR